MAGHSTANAARLGLENGVAHVGGAELADIRPTKRQFTPEQMQESLARLEKLSGAAVCGIVEQAQAYGLELRRELSEIAGCELPATVQALAELTIGSVEAWHMGLLLQRGVMGRWGANQIDAALGASAAAEHDEKASKALRNVAGLAVVARDMLERTREAAKACRTKTDSVGGLLETLGVTADPGREPPDRPPLDPPGVDRSGAPLSSSPPSKKKGLP